MASSRPLLKGVYHADEDLRTQRGIAISLRMANTQLQSLAVERCSSRAEGGRGSGRFLVISSVAIKSIRYKNSRDPVCSRLRSLKSGL